MKNYPQFIQKPPPPLPELYEFRGNILRNNILDKPVGAANGLGGIESVGALKSMGLNLNIKQDTFFGARVQTRSLGLTPLDPPCGSLVYDSLDRMVGQVGVMGTFQPPPSLTGPPHEQ